MAGITSASGIASATSSTTTAFTLSTSSRLSDDKKALTCSVCLELFNEPKILPCCHTFCLKCLEKIASTKKKGELTCPQCRKSHVIPKVGLAAFLSDFTASHELEVFSAKLTKTSLTKQSRKCGECGGEGPIQSYCKDCQNYLCRECSTLAHKKFKAYSGHKVIPIQELDSATLQSFQVHYCTAHKDEPIKLYCNTCQKLICRDCTLVEHRQHDYKFAHDARKQTDNQLRMLVQSVTQKFLNFKANLAEIEKVETAVSSYPEVLKTDVNTYFDTLIRSLEQRRHQLLAQAETECQKDLKQVWADKTFHQTTMAEMTAVFGVAEKACKSTSDVEMIMTALQCINVLSQLQKTQWDGCAFSNVISSPPAFAKGTIPKVNSVGGIQRLQTESISNSTIAPKIPASSIIEQDIVFEVIHPQLIEKRSNLALKLKVNKDFDVKVNATYTNTESRNVEPYYSSTPTTQFYQTGYVPSVTRSQSLAALLHQPTSKNGSVSVAKIEDGKHKVTIKPDRVGKYTIEVTVNGKPVNGSPFTVNVTANRRVNQRQVHYQQPYI